MCYHALTLFLNTASSSPLPSVFTKAFSELSEEREKIILPFAGKLCVFGRMHFPWRTGSPSLPWERRDHSKKRCSGLFICLTCPNTHGHVPGLGWAAERRTHINAHGQTAERLFLAQKTPRGDKMEALWGGSKRLILQRRTELFAFNAASILTPRAEGCVVCKTHAVTWTPCWICRGRRWN